MTHSFPKQIKYIIGNEACERFSYYGMRSILIVFMTQTLLIPAANAKSTYHLFISACYLLPLLGAYLSDKVFGKFKTIFYLSLVYCLGHGVLAAFESEVGLYVGLGLIALGSGGIKPCVSAFVGDQFTEENKDALPKVFDVFYFSINFGAFFSSLFIPEIKRHFGSGVAFGIPGILMVIATVILWLGRKQYIQVELSSAKKIKSTPEEKKVDRDILISIFQILVWVSVFWALFDQQGSSWVIQAQKMNLTILGYTLDASQIQALNPILVMGMIPLFTFFIYPLVRKMGVNLTPLKKMSAGMVLAAVSFYSVGLIQAAIDGGATLSVAWQFIPYFLITAAEIMVSITGLEFAYTQAPEKLKSTIMSFWLLTVFVGNLLTAYISKLNQFQGAAEFYFYALLTAAVSVVFIVQSVRYKYKDELNAGILGKV